MPENTNIKKNTRGVKLRSPEDARRVVKRLVNECFRQGVEVEMMGRITNALNTWLKAWEIEKSAELERRLEDLEKKYEEDRRG